MALYFLKKEKNPCETPKDIKPSRGHEWISYVGALLLLTSAIIQAIGLDALSLPLADGMSHLLPPGLMPPSPKVILLTMDRDAEGFDPLDVAMALRGLGKLHPSRVIINGNVRRKPDSLTILEGVRGRLIQDGITLIEGTPSSPDALWRPVPLCTYTPPSSWPSVSSLPRIQGRSAAEGKSCFLPSTEEKAPSLLPLIAATDSGEIAGSVWWESMMPIRATGPLWLLAGKLLLFPNHAPLLISSGGANILSTSTTMVVAMDLFLLRIEEKERGTFSPDFESLWDHATVVVGTSDDIHLTGSLHSILRSISFHRLPLLSQAAMALLLIVLLFVMRRLPPQNQLGMALALVTLTIGAGGVALHHALLLPILPPLILAYSLLLSSFLSSRR